MSFMHVEFGPAVDLLKQLMREQVANPARACVNSETTVVRMRMEQAGEFYIARQYWDWACGSQFVNPDVLVLFDQEVVALQKQLQAIDQAIQLPEWAHAGT
jgi:hypothetical protein